jgi:hypothetical protein
VDAEGHRVLLPALKRVHRVAGFAYADSRTRVRGALAGAGTRLKDGDSDVHFLMPPAATWGVEAVRQILLHLQVAPALATALLERHRDQ